jgi:hypothetical protein
VEEIELELPLKVGEERLIGRYGGPEAVECLSRGQVDANVGYLLLFIAMRRKDPSLTIERFDGMTSDQLPRLKVIGEEPNPTSEAG